MSVTPTADLVGKRLDETYEIVAKLGEGGMGVVYEAEHTKTRRRVAIKVILGNFTPDETLVARFQREARAAGSIDSRHIAQVLDAGTDPATGAPYLVMELLKGRDLDTLMKTLGPIRPTLALRLMAQALAGLERAHGAKVIHRDIKPANLYIAEADGDARVLKIVDFGVAKVKDDLNSSREHTLTRTSSLLGSPLYMSPEQARTSKSVDGRADIWSLGTVFYQLLAGEAPHHLATSLTELLLAICTEPAPPIQTRAPWVPPEVAAIVAKALEIDVADRYPNTSAMLADIEAIVPDWQRLEEGMITPMTDEERAFVAKRLDPPPELHVSTGPNSSKTISDSRLIAVGAPFERTAVNSVRPRPEAFEPEKKKEKTSDAKEDERKKRPVIPVAIGVVALAVFGGVFAASRRADPPRPAPLVPATVTVTVTVSAPAPAPVMSPSPPAEPKPSAAPAPVLSLSPPAEPKPSAAPKPRPAAAPPKPGPSPAPAPNAPPSSISREFN